MHLSHIHFRETSVPNVHSDDTQTESENPSDLMIDKVVTESTSTPSVAVPVRKSVRQVSQIDEELLMKGFCGEFTSMSCDAVWLSFRLVCVGRQATNEFRNYRWLWNQCIRRMPLGTFGIDTSDPSSERQFRLSKQTSSLGTSFSRSAVNKWSAKCIWKEK